MPIHEAPLAALDSFSPFSVTHALVIFAFLAMTAALCLYGRWWRGSPRGRRLDLILAATTMGIWMWAVVFGCLPWRYETSKALPLQVCRLVGLMAPLALWTNRRTFRALLYFCGIGLSTQAFITPDLQEGPSDPSFWVFWTTHFAIVGTAFYDLVARRFRPTWRDAGIAAAALAVYLLLIIPFDIAFGFNYGYVGRGTSVRPTIVDVLGPWPWRVVILAALVAAMLALLVLPWELVRWVQESRRDPSGVKLVPLAGAVRLAPLRRGERSRGEPE